MRLVDDEPSLLSIGLHAGEQVVVSLLEGGLSPSAQLSFFTGKLNSSFYQAKLLSYFFPPKYFPPKSEKQMVVPKFPITNYKEEEI